MIAENPVLFQNKGLTNSSEVANNKKVIPDTAKPEGALQPEGNGNNKAELIEARQDIEKLKERIVSLETEKQEGKKEEKEEKAPSKVHFEPYPRTVDLGSGSLGNALKRQLIRRTTPGISRFWKDRQVQEKPGWIRRLAKIPGLGFLARSGMKTLPSGARTIPEFYSGITTVGDVARVSGQFAASTISPAVSVGVLGGVVRTGTDLGRWVLNSETSTEIAAREFAGRKTPDSGKGKAEWKTIFNHNDLADVSQIADLSKEVEEGVSAYDLGYSPDEIKRLIKKAAALKLDKLTFLNKMSSGVRTNLSEIERLRLDDIDSAFKVADKMYESLASREKAYFLYNDLLPYLRRRETWNHAKLVAKRGVIFGLGTGLVGAATSLVKSLDKTRLLSDWGRRLSITVKDGATNIWNSTSTWAKNTGHSIYKWMGTLKLPWVKPSLPPPPPVSSQLPTGTWKFELGKIIGPSGQEWQVIFPKKVTP